ncbi:NAD-dependent epimerase/dehydratase family protein [Fimbriimonas ginsengisoli]|nr:NAD-dependent epimerase/dehydratase family protein [Fimbriimonas ginsengisoli]
MNKSVLITGGAGFIGSHLADELLANGYRVRILDSLSPQVHGSDGKRPDYLSPDVELMVGDVRNPEAVKRALIGIDHVYHFAAIVGVGQSMYDIARYTEVNNLGTAVVLEALVAQPVEHLVIASSMSLYGEGLYKRPDGQIAEASERSIDQLRAQDWQVRDVEGNALTPVATPEWKRPTLPSIYALSKYDQERMCLMIGKAYNIPTVALRFFNAFGTRQALSNPYTGVLAIFGSRLLNDKPPLIFEDGQQLRDFVSVKDVARSCRLAIEREEATGRAINVGSGMSYTIEETARKVAKAMGKEHIEPEICGQYRVGDVRHCFPDITLARELLGYEPQILLDDGLAELAEWLQEQTAIDKVDEMRQQLASRGLTI